MARADADEETTRTEDAGVAPGSRPGLPKRSSALLTAARARFEGSTLQQVLKGLAALDFANRIVLFGSSLLLSVLPFVILMSTFASQPVDDDIARHIGLDAKGSHVVDQLFTASSRHPVASTVIALVVALAGTIGVAGSLQAVYENVFDQQRRGLRDFVRFVVWVFVLFGALLAEAVISSALRHVPARVFVQGLMTFAGVTAFFWWTMHFLLAGRVRWRVLLPSAVFTGLLWMLLEGLGSIYFSSTIDSDSETYGKIGVVFGLTTWFIAIGAVIVLGGVVGSAFRRRKRRAG